MNVCTTMSDVLVAVTTVRRNLYVLAPTMRARLELYVGVHTTDLLSIVVCPDRKGHWTLEEIQSRESEFAVTTTYSLALHYIGDILNVVNDEIFNGTLDKEDIDGQVTRFHDHYRSRDSI